MAREHIKARTIALLESSINSRINNATGMTDAIRAQLEAMKAKTLHVAHQQPAEWYESVWTGTDADTVRAALAKLKPLCQ